MRDGLWSSGSHSGEVETALTADGLTLVGSDFGLISLEFVRSNADRVLPWGVELGDRALPEESERLHLDCCNRGVNERSCSSHAAAPEQKRVSGDVRPSRCGSIAHLVRWDSQLKESSGDRPVARDRRRSPNCALVTTDGC